MKKQEKVKIGIDNYEQFWNMLNSSDKENAVVGLSVMETANFRDSLPYILLLLKNQHGTSRKLWDDHCPKVLKNLKSVGIKIDEPITYQKIYDLVKEKCSKEALHFVVEKFIPILQRYAIESWGFKFLNDVIITTKLKDE